MAITTVSVSSRTCFQRTVPVPWSFHARLSKNRYVDIDSGIWSWCRRWVVGLYVLFFFCFFLTKFIYIIWWFLRKKYAVNTITVYKQNIQIRCQFNFLFTWRSNYASKFLFWYINKIDHGFPFSSTTIGHLLPRRNTWVDQQADGLLWVQDTRCP